jgi:PAS domain S-box-containing protein
MPDENGESENEPVQDENRESENGPVQDENRETENGAGPDENGELENEPVQNEGGDMENSNRQKDILEKLITNIPAMIVGTDLDGNIAIFNKEAEKVTGYIAENVIGQSFLELLVAVEEHQDTAGVFHISNESGPLYDIQRHMKTKGGDELMISWSCGVMNDTDGSTIGIIFTGTDATENEVMESLGELGTSPTENVKALPTAQFPSPPEQEPISDQDETILKAIAADMEWQSAFNSIADPIAIIDKDNTILRINRTCAQLIDSEPEDLVGRTCCDVFKDIDSPLHSFFHKNAQEEGEMSSEEVSDPSSGKNTLITCFPYHDDFGEFIGSIIMAKDIACRCKGGNGPETKEKVVKITEMDQLISAINHELNNPLGGVLGYAEALADEEDPLKIRFYSKEIKDGVARVSKILSSLTRYSQKQPTWKTESLDLNDVIETSLNFLKEKGKFEGVDIAKDLSQIPKINGSQNDIQQVLIYLLTNSIEAMEGKGRIEISTRSENGNVQAVFRDEGKEISKEHIAWIFNPSVPAKEKGDATVYKKMEMGLRMHAVKTILKKYNIPFNVESESESGRTFTMDFPLIESK